MLQSSKSKRLFLQIASTLSVKLFAQSMHCCSCCGAAQGDMRHRLSEASEHFDLTNKHSKGLPQGTSIGGSDHIYTKHVIDNLDSDTIWYHMTPMILWEAKSADWTWAIQDHSTASALCNQAKRACTMSFCTGCISRQMFSPACLCFFSIRVSTGTSQFLFFTGVPWGPYTFTGHHTCLSSIFAYVRVLAVEVEAIPTWGLSFIHFKTACRNEISREWIMWRTWWHSICFRKKKSHKKEPSAGFRDCSPACSQLRWQLSKDEVTVVPPDSCAMQRVPCKYCPKDSDLSKNHDLPTYLCERLQIK